MSGGINLYAYALNDPINLVDPTGKFVFLLPAVIWGVQYTTGMALADLAITVTLGLTANQAFQATQGNNASFFPNITSGGACPNGDDEDPDNKKSNFEKINDNYLTKKGIDPHELKREYLGQKAKISKYDLYKDKNTGKIHILRKGGKGSSIETYINIR